MKLERFIVVFSLIQLFVFIPGANVYALEGTVTTKGNGRLNFITECFSKEITLKILPSGQKSIVPLKDIKSFIFIDVESDRMCKYSKIKKGILELRNGDKYEISGVTYNWVKDEIKQACSFQFNAIDPITKKIIKDSIRFDKIKSIKFNQ